MTVFVDVTDHCTTLMLRKDDFLHGSLSRQDRPRIKILKRLYHRSLAAEAKLQKASVCGAATGRGRFRHLLCSSPGQLERCVLYFDLRKTQEAVQQRTTVPQLKYLHLDRSIRGSQRVN